MPFVLNYTGEDRGAHPDAYWTPTRVEINLAAEVAVIEYTGYHDAETWSEGGPPVVGAVRSYVVSGSDYHARLAEHLGGTATLADLAESLAASDPFFAGATQVPFPAPA